MTKNLVNEASKLLRKGLAQERRKQLAAEKEKEDAMNKTKDQAEIDAPVIRESILAAIKKVAATGKDRLDYSLGRSQPGYNSLLHLTAENAVNLLTADGFNAVIYFNEEWVNGGNTGDSYSMDDYGISVWGW